jgi:ABC-type phosphate transport system substrate-binding protein
VDRDGVIVFTVVVNRATHVYNLTSAQVGEIFSGAITNWRQLGGADLPIDIVSRDSGSGTRRAFDRYVLDGAAEPEPSSFDCTDKDAVPSARITLCQEPATSSLLDEVARIPGAIGYAETSDVAASTAGTVQPVQLDGIADALGDVGTRPGNYHFWTVEYLYTYGSPADGSLGAQFLTYMGSFAAKDALRSSGYTPCDDGKQDLMATLCAPGAR